MIRFFYYLFYLLVLMTPNGWISADDGKPPILLLGALGTSNESVAVSSIVDSENPELTGEYRVSVDVRLKTSKQPVYKKFPLQWGKDESKQTVFQFKEGRRKTELNIEPYVIARSEIFRPKSKTSINEFDELWIDYRDLVPEDPARLDIKINYLGKVVTYSGEERISPKPVIQTVIVRSAEEALIEVGQADMESAVWVPKDLLYLFRRNFELEHDVNWRYREIDADIYSEDYRSLHVNVEHVVMQRRFALDLMGIDVLEVVLGKDAILDMVNLRLKLDESTMVVPWRKLPKWIQYDDSGRQHVFLLIQKLLAQRFPKEEKVVLSEMIVFLAGESGQVLSDRPIKTLRWLSLKRDDQNKPEQEVGGSLEVQQEDITPSGPVSEKSISYILLSTEETLHDKGKKRFKIKLDPIVGEFINDGESTIDSIRLLMASKSYNQLDGSGIELEDISFIRKDERRLPDIALLGKKQLEQWGVRMEMEEEAFGGEQFLWPLIDGYFPFTDDVQVKDPGGEGAWIDIDWPVEATLREGMRLQLGLTGGEGNIGNVRVTALSDGVAVGNWIMPVGGSVEMAGNWGLGQPVDRIVLRVFLEHDREKVVFDKLVLFRPKHLSFDEVMDQPLYAFDLSAVRFPMNMSPSILLVRDLIKMQALVKSNGKFFSPGAIDWSPYRVSRLDVGEFRLNRPAETVFDLEFPEHLWLEIRRVILERKQPFSVDEWNRVVMQKEPTMVQNKKRKWVQWIFFVVAVVVVVWWLACNGLGQLQRALSSIWPQSRKEVRSFSSRLRGSLFWLASSFALYGSSFAVHRVSDLSMFDYRISHTLGGIAAVLAWRDFVRWVQPRLVARWPKLARNVYEGAGTHYFSGFIVVFAVAVIMLLLNLELIAEQLAVVGYYMLIVGVLLEVQSLYRGRGTAIKGKV
jgi:hypothetical protein